MERVKRYLSGGHSPAEIRWHLVLLVGGYWGLVLCAWLGYPSENHFSVTTRMLSALGSFETGNNPHWFWVFSVAMVYCGLCMAPVVLYVRRRLLPVSAVGASVGTLFFLTGCGAIMLTGLLPYAHREVLGWNLARLHLSAAALITVCFGLGFVWHGVLLVTDRFARNTFGGGETGPYLPLFGPFLVGIPILAAVGSRIRWRAAFSALTAACGGSAGEAVDDLARAVSDMGHFPLLEHLSIWALTLFIVWFTVVLPHRGEE